MNRPKPQSGPRFRVQRVNGVFHVFDSVYYGVVDAKPTEKAAAQRAAQLNERHASGEPKVRR